MRHCEVGTNEGRRRKEEEKSKPEGMLACGHMEGDRGRKEESREGGGAGEGKTVAGGGRWFRCCRCCRVGWVPATEGGRIWEESGWVKPTSCEPVTCDLRLARKNQVRTTYLDEGRRRKEEGKSEPEGMLACGRREGDEGGRRNRGREEELGKEKRLPVAGTDYVAAGAAVLGGYRRLREGGAGRSWGGENQPATSLRLATCKGKPGAYSIPRRREKKEGRGKIEAEGDAGVWPQGGRSREGGAGKGKSVAGGGHWLPCCKCCRAGWLPTKEGRR